MPKECLVFYYRGRPYLVKRNQAAKNFNKYLKGKLPGCRITGGGSVIEAADIEFLIRSELQRTGRKGRKIGSKPIFERK